MASPPNNQQNISASQIAVCLNKRMGDLARDLLGEPNKALSSADQWRYGAKGSLAVEIRGEKAGTWFDHEEGCGGDALNLIKHKRDMNTNEAFGWAKEWLGLSSSVQTPTQLPKEPTAKVAFIVAESHSILNTPVARYLERRGITATIPDCIRFREKAFGKFGAMVALATDTEGKVLALQQIYLTEDEQKAPVEIVKRTNKAIDKWSEKATVRFPGKEPIILAEGVETALSLWQATGQETFACLGISNIARAPLPEKARIVVARDGDHPGSKADNQITRVFAKLKARGFDVMLASPPEGKDFNDVLIEGGDEAVRTAIKNAALPQKQDNGFKERSLYIGSDVEIAKCVREDLIERYGPIVCAEGFFWRYNQTQWEVIPESELHQATHPYDGIIYETPRGEPVRVKLSNSRIESSLRELSFLIMQPDFFVDTPVGINCASGFVHFTAQGEPSLIPHSRDHRCRNMLPGHWSPKSCGTPPAGSLLYQLLEGTFKDDADKADKTSLLSEIFGAAALRHGTKLRQPKAAIFKGEKAENGKSQFLDLARGILSKNAICSLSAAKMSDERHVIGLVGKLLNASDELSSSAAISSDTFKAVITGEPVEGRDVYKSRFEFRPTAQHIFATNNLPPFQGGMDRGVQRRLLVVTFNRIIPIDERIEGIGRRIASEEADLLLAWVVEGATRLFSQRDFTVPLSSKEALREWILGADPVVAWLTDCVEIMPPNMGFPPPVSTRRAYEEFYNWALAEGFKKDKLPAINGFVQRVKANAAPSFESKRTSEGHFFLGFHIKRTSSSSSW